MRNDLPRYDKCSERIERKKKNERKGEGGWLARLTGVVEDAWWGGKAVTAEDARYERRGECAEENCAGGETGTGRMLLSEHQPDICFRVDPIPVDLEMPGS